MSDETSDPLGLLAAAQSLQDKATASAAELTRLQAEIADLVKIPETGPVTVTFDDAGYMTSLEIDAEARASLDSRALVTEINFAISRASRPIPAPPAVSPESLENAAELFEQIFAMAGGDSVGEPVTYSNDLGTVTVTLVWGSVFSVECSDSWIGAASDSSISEEIVRTARSAVTASGPRGRE
jgi:hypothetical protein